MDRPVIDPMEQLRDFDFVQGAHDVLVALAGLAADVTSDLPYTILGGLVATQTIAPSLSINISSGRIYQFAPADAVASGSIQQDLTIIVQQGFNAGQTLALVAPSAGQSQWNLVQAQFSQVDAVRANDPNGGIVPFYNAANPAQPTLNSINTVRQGLCVLQVISGSAATTGSEVPPSPTSGWVPLYLIDLAGGQTQITTSQIIVCGPSVGTGVPSNYPVAPFLAGLLASHHSGAQGQAPKIKLGSEVQGVLPYANMSAVRTLLNAGLTLYVNTTTGADTNNGLTPATAFKTMQAAVNAGYHNYDFNGNALTISVANGTYSVTQGANANAVLFQGMPLGCPLVALVGNNGSPGSVTLSCSGGTGINIAFGATVNVSGMTITTAGSNQGLGSFSGYGMTVQQGSYATISNIVFGSCGSVQLLCQGGATVSYAGPVTHSGTTLNSVYSQLGSLIYNVGNTVTVTGLTTTNSFVVATQTGTVDFGSNTFIGTSVGQKYVATTNGVISSAGGGINYFPGTIAGAVATGGQYV